MTRPLHRWQRLIVTGLLAFWCLGCGNEPTPENDQGIAAPDAVSADHDHDHAHADTGPNGGHLIELKGGAYHAEWLHDDEAGKITIFVLEDAVTANPDLDVTDVVITTKIAGGATSQYTLKNSSSSDGDSNAPCFELPCFELACFELACFELTDQVLLTAMKIGEGVVCTVSITIGGEQLEAEIEHHAQCDHH